MPSPPHAVPTSPTDGSTLLIDPSLHHLYYSGFAFISTACNDPQPLGTAHYLSPSFDAFFFPALSWRAGPPIGGPARSLYILQVCIRPPSHRLHPVRDWGDNKGKETSDTKKRTKIKANKTKQNKTSEGNEQVPQISVSVHLPHRCHPVRVWGDKS